MLAQANVILDISVLLEVKVELKKHVELDVQTPMLLLCIVLRALPNTSMSLMIITQLRNLGLDLQEVVSLLVLQAISASWD
jgi:hypothetical protein